MKRRGWCQRWRQRARHFLRSCCRRPDRGRERDWDRGWAAGAGDGRAGPGRAGGPRRGGWRPGGSGPRSQPVASATVLHAFVLIDAEPARIADLAEELADVDGVAEVYSVAGEADIVAIVRVRHHDELADVVTRRITALDGIVSTRTLIAFQAFSRHDLDALWDLGAEAT
jgi:DNA-binding Lrp family transcriptional regulator